jgi:putative transposase
MHRTSYDVRTLCQTLCVARSGYYAWLHTPLSDRAIEDQRLLKLIRDSYEASGGIYGSRRVWGDLREVGEPCGKNRIERIMRENRIHAVRGYRSPRARYGRPSLLAPNRVQQQFNVERPDQIWVTDITYIRTGKAGCI